MTPNLVVFEDLGISNSTAIRLAVECFAPSANAGFDVAVEMYEIYNNQLY